MLVFGIRGTHDELASAALRIAAQQLRPIGRRWPLRFGDGENARSNMARNSGGISAWPLVAFGASCLWRFIPYA